MSEISKRFIDLLQDRTTATSTALRIIQQIAEQILLSEGQRKPGEEKEVYIFFTIPIIRGSISDWPETVSQFDELGGYSKDHLRPFVNLALKMLPGPREKTFLTKRVKAIVESGNADLDTIVMELKEVTEQAVMLERCLVEFDEGRQCEDDKRYADAVARYQSGIELCPRALTPSRAALHANRSTCFLQQQLWTEASNEAKKSIDTLEHIDGDYSSEEQEEAGVEVTRAESWRVRIRALLEIGDLAAATEAYLTALSLIHPDISSTRPVALEPSCSSLLSIMWSKSTVAQIVSIAEQECQFLTHASDDSQTFSPDLGSVMQFLSCVKITPEGGLDWSGNDRHGFWFRSHVVITLLSLATIPQYYSYCSFGKAELREILHVQPRKAFRTALGLKLKTGLHQIAKSITNIVKKIRMSLVQTAQHHLSHSTWGKNTAMIHRIAFRVARDRSMIKELDSVETLLGSILVYEDGEIDYQNVEVVDRGPGMTLPKARAFVRQLLKVQYNIPRTYHDALFSMDLSGLKTLLDKNEGRSVFELMQCSFALLYSQSYILDEEEIEGMKMVKRMVEVVTTSSSIRLDPSVLKLMNRLASLPVEGAVDDEVASLVGAIVVLIFKAEA